MQSTASALVALQGPARFHSDLALIQWPYFLLLFLIMHCKKIALSVTCFCNGLVLRYHLTWNVQQCVFNLENNIFKACPTLNEPIHFEGDLRFTYLKIQYCVKLSYSSIWYSSMNWDCRSMLNVEKTLKILLLLFFVQFSCPLPQEKNVHVEASRS